MTNRKTPAGHTIDAAMRALDAIADVALAYRPKAKSKPARRRKREANKIAKEKG